MAEAVLHVHSWLDAVMLCYATAILPQAAPDLAVAEPMTRHVL